MADRPPTIVPPVSNVASSPPPPEPPPLEPLSSEPFSVAPGGGAMKADVAPPHAGGPIIDVSAHAPTHTKEGNERRRNRTSLVSGLKALMGHGEGERKAKNAPEGGMFHLTRVHCLTGK